MYSCLVTTGHVVDIPTEGSSVSWDLDHNVGEIRVKEIKYLLQITGLCEFVMVAVMRSNLGQRTVWKTKPVAFTKYNTRTRSRRANKPRQTDHIKAGMAVPLAGD